jgi:hypothetical protein
MGYNRHHIADLDLRAANAGAVNVQVELTCLRAGVDPHWERPTAMGVTSPTSPHCGRLINVLGVSHSRRAPSSTVKGACCSASRVPDLPPG